MGMVTGEESSRQREPLCEEGARSLTSLNLSFLICVVRIMAVSADPQGCCRGCRREAWGSCLGRQVSAGGDRPEALLLASQPVPPTPQVSTCRVGAWG